MQRFFDLIFIYLKNNKKLGRPFNKNYQKTHQKIVLMGFQYKYVDLTS